ncbi:gfo/Idh/MocA family oxidoreductase [Marinomonas piezotolerans]|uniref:Gfo/Idh/MocA family oxidoreductase n=1 Tax=Marinomonas piezotolerans TaxID=2213058 RepID=A0A370UCM3_9GAMM|nr:Gfo/Idh/MocA family oxidoreductase [Marinomonas piezotolerans]RDL45481.1 gfo/Idh/MocA family oxidoreductase [Marinomonas piezotolerans]
MTHKRIRIGMVGGGDGAFIGAVHRIAARIDDGFELVAGALSSAPERALASALRLGIDPERAYTSFATMAEQEKQREDGIQAVVIVTPNHMHYPVAKAFLEQGIHVICDKPVTKDLNEALALKTLVEKSGAFFALTHNYTGYPLVRHAKHLVDTNVLGALRVIQVEYAQDWLSNPAENTDNKQAKWRTDPEKSGMAGCLGDIGTHAFNLACFISGQKVKQVSADLTAFVNGRRLDDNVHTMLRFDGGVKGMLWSSQVAPGNENGLKIRLYGEKAGIEWSQESPNELWLSVLNEPTQKITRAGHGAGDEANRLSRVPAGHPEGYLEGFANLYLDIASAIHAIESGASADTVQGLIPSIDDGVDGMRFITAVLASSASNSAWQPLEVNDR